MAYSYHPFPIVSIIKSIILTIILIVLAFMLRDFLGSFTLIVVLIIAALGFLGVTRALIVAQTYTVTLGEKGITFTQGLFARKEVVIRYSQVTEASYTQGLLQRIFGIGNISVDTPGGSEMAMRLPDVRHSDIRKTLDRIEGARK